MSWREVWILYTRELRSALRERSIVVNSILMPIFLYPVLLWAVLSGATLVEGLSEDLVSRVAVEGMPQQHGELRGDIEQIERLEVLEPRLRGPGSLETAVQQGELDAVLVLRPAGDEAAALADNFVAEIVYDQASERSRRAQIRLQEAVDRYRETWLGRESEARGISAEQRVQFRVEQANVAAGEETSASLLWEMVPLLLIIMIAAGCFYPAIDSTAGERERSTWETLMTVSASRSSILAAKYLYVGTMGITAGLLNVFAMVFTIGAVLAPMLGGDDANGPIFRLPLEAVPIMALGAIGLALLFAALMMILAAFARTFKDGQAMITPVYYLALFPILLVVEPEIALNARTALLPVANVVLMIREALQGTFQWLFIAQTTLVVLALVGLSLALARYLLRFEDLLLGSYGGSFWTFLKERMLRRSPGANEPVRTESVSP